MSKHPEGQLTALLIAVNVLVIACGGGGGGTQPPPGDVITISKTTEGSGDAQAGTVGQPVASPLQVLVTENGSAAAGVTVSWSTATADGTLTPPSGATNPDGMASSSWLLGTASGAQTARATVPGANGSPVTFSATAAADAAATLAPAGGDGQSGLINTQLSAPVQAKVADRFGNGVPEVDVGWAATGGTVSGETVATDAAGVSRVSVTLGGSAGPIIITATAGSLIGSPLMFAATATTAPTTAAVSIINNSFSPPAITVSAGTTVVWTWSNAARQHNVTPVGTIPIRSGSPADGPTTYQFRFDTPGTYSYYCEVHGGPGFGMAGTVTVQ
jgi:plastocyanin